jgi:hypothetical protein
MTEKHDAIIRRGRITVSREDTGEVLYRADNIITDVSRWLFSIFMATASPISLSPPQTQPISVPAVEPAWGAWGLALGAGSPTWAPETQPIETASQVAMVQEIARIRLSRINFVTQDNSGNFNPVNTISTSVDFQTTVNPTVDGIVQAIREMGLIGGGLPSTPMQTAPYFDGVPSSYPSVAAAQQTVILLNYKTLPPLLLPPGINIIFSWIFSF